MKPRRFQSRTGFTLVEVALALGVAAFCIVPVVGLLVVGYNSNQASLRQTTAAAIAAAIGTDLKATASPSGTSPYFGLTIPAAGTQTTVNLFVQDDGVKLATPSPNRPTFLATVVLSSAAADRLNAGYARILITWPALPNQGGGAVPIRYDGSLETIIGLNSN